MPDPVGLAALIGLLHSVNFRDVTGLTANQANAAAALQQNVAAALEYGKEASKLAQQAAMLQALDKSMASIDKQASQGKIKPEDAEKLRKAALEKAVGGTDGEVKANDVKERLGLIKRAAQEGSIDTPAAQDLTESVLRSYAGPGQKISDEQAAAAKKISELPPSR